MAHIIKSSEVTLDERAALMSIADPKERLEYLASEMIRKQFEASREYNRSLKMFYDALAMEPVNRDFKLTVIKGGRE